jgi:hypothetical protein
VPVSEQAVGSGRAKLCLSRGFRVAFARDVTP